MRLAITTFTTRAVMALAALAGASVASAAMFANVMVPPGGETVLDAGRAEGFAVSGQNVGHVALQVVARAGGHDRRLATVDPGGRLDQVFAPHEAAVLRNPSPAEEAVAMVRMVGTDGHGGGADSARQVGHP